MRLDLILLFLGALIVCGPQVVEFLFDPRYAAAGWMLQLVAIRSACACLSRPTFALQTARGRPQSMMWKHVVTLPMVIVAIPLGFELGGIRGALLVVALSEVPGLILSWAMLARARVLSPIRELWGLVILAAGLGIGLLVAWIVA
jgi:O-antigen/teichoic acid export membrane protein